MFISMKNGTAFGFLRLRHEKTYAVIGAELTTSKKLTWKSRPTRAV
jgi:hypothetical protein